MVQQLKESKSRRTTDAAVRVYSFGVPFLRAESEEIIKHQVYQAHRYRNELVRIEIDRRDRFRAIRRTLSPRMENLESEYDRVSEEYQEQRKRLCEVPKAKRDNDPLVLAVKETRTLRNSLWKFVQAEREIVEEEYFSEAQAEYKRRLEVILLAHAATKDPRVLSRPKGLSDEDHEKIVKAAKNLIGPQTKKHFPNTVRSQMFDEHWPESWKEKERSEQEAEKAIKVARRKAKEAGCSTGTRAAIDAAVKKSFEDSRFNPRQKPFEHTGLVGMQLTTNKGLRIAEAFDGTDLCLKLKMHPEIRVRAYERALRRYQKGLRKEKPPQAASAVIKLEGSGEKAVRVHIPFLMHREFPSDGVLKWVYLKVDRLGTKPLYELQFHVESHEFKIAPQGQDTLAVRLGWRKLGSGAIQVATTWDGQKAGTIQLPAWMAKKDEKADFLLGTADNIFDGVKADLLGWLGKDQKRWDIVEEALQEWQQKHWGRTNDKKLRTGLPQWRSHGNLAILTFALCEKFTTPETVKTLASKWRAARLSAKLDLFDSFEEITRWLRKQGITDPVACVALYLEWWRQKDQHLINWARNIKRRLRLHRREIYRKFAHDSGKIYGTVVLGSWDKRKSAETPEPEDDTRTKQEENANAVRQFCGVSVLQESITHIFGKALRKIPVSAILPVHYGCGGSYEVTEGQQHGICSMCHRQYDHDANAARQLWALHCEPPTGTRPLKRSKKAA